MLSNRLTNYQHSLAPYCRIFHTLIRLAWWLLIINVIIQAGRVLPEEAVEGILLFFALVSGGLMIWVAVIWGLDWILKEGEK